MPIHYAPIITPEGLRTKEDGTEICGAALRKKAGLWCSRLGQFLNPVNRRCRLHGGKSLSGMAHPELTHGMSSKYIGPYSGIPHHLIQGVVRNLQDPHLLELREEVAVTMERANDLMKRVDHGESGHLWQELKKTLQELEQARQAGDPALEATSFATLRDLIERGTSDYRGWEEIGKQFDRKQRLTESEAKKGHMAPADQTLVMIGTLVRAIRECVLDVKVLAAVQDRFNAILGANFPAHQQPTILEGPGRTIEISQDS